ncbi:MAG: alanine--tRNA ligase [Alphaproteobacteria bacterium]|nr:alanine--tRNA ligase [Alphaproteobacteria bacterium]
MSFTYHELRNLWLDFFKSKGHAEIPSASVFPENDPTVLFTTAGMHPLVPYLMGQKHPAGKRLTDIQKCIRTNDIADVGDYCHLTFFQMMGNWSLGDYFKKEMVAWSFEFLTQKLGFKKEQLAVTCFAGDKDAPRDDETAGYWKEQGLTDDQIFFCGKEDNWWGPAGQTGPCGPDTEMFIDNGQPKCGPDCRPGCHCGKYTEVWNDVFMQYNKKEDGTYELLAQKNVDTGMGLERTLCFLNGIQDVYSTELFSDTIKQLETLSGKKYNDDLKAFRKIADHLRTSVFIMGDDRGLTPSNTDQGYILRRLIRIAIRNMKKLGIDPAELPHLAETVINRYASDYAELGRNKQFILEELAKEEKLFSRTLTTGLKEMDKVIVNLKNKTIDGQTAFHLYDTYGFPLEFTEEIAAEHGLNVDVDGFNKCFEAHQALSRAGSEQKFKCGLSDHSEETTNLHSATHLLHAALRKVLGDEVAQKGSNITPERLRFDFSFGRKMTPEEVKQVEDLVNDAINRKMPITCEEMPLDKAVESGATALFKDRYDTELVKVYTMGDFSKEVCGGPHATNTGDLGHFKIKKEESSSAGVRRIKAVLEK